MALPVVLIDSASGSDSAASGAGPSTALFGTADASTSGTGLVVTLTAGTDLSGVSTTGSDVLYLADSTAGARNFGKITATAGSGGATPTVTVADAFGLSLSGKSWAVGGKRASLGSSTSRKLVENNSSSGDWMPGWKISLASGHAETITSTLTLRRDGDTTSGPVTIYGEAGTRPIITANVAGIAVTVASQYAVLENIQVKNSNASGSYLVNLTGGNFRARKVRLGGGTQDNANDGFLVNNTNGGHVFESCEVSDCRYGIQAASDSPATSILGCYIHDNNNHGVYFSSNGHALLEYNVIAGNAGSGVRIDDGGSVFRISRVVGNTVAGNTADGILITSTGTGVTGMVVVSNQLTTNGGYALNFSGAPAVALLRARCLRALGNSHYGNTSGWCNLTLTADVESGTVNIDPAYVGSGDYTPTGATLEGKAFPVSIP